MADADASRRFIPPYPPRGEGPVSAWRGFFGERARTAVYGWSEAAFGAPYFKRKVLGYTVHIPLRPELVEHVLLTNAANYVKPDIVKKLLHRTIGSGLLSSDGELWRDQRRIVAANFAPAPIDSLIPTFTHAASGIAAGWQEGNVDVAAAATATTMRIIADSLFACDERLTTEAAVGHIKAALEGFGEARMQALLGLPIMPWSRKGKRAHAGQRYLRETLTRVVKDRGADGGPDDFLGGLIRALHAKFPPAEAEALAVDNAATFYLAGHETTANALAWTLFLLSEQPALQERCAAEAEAALTGGEADPDLPERLPLLRRVLEESLRLYPPAPRFDRQAVAADRIGDHDVNAGDIVSLWPWLLHRHRDLWVDPDVFDPDRFLPEAKAARHRFAYIPFGGGPRLCVGMRFATIEALAVLAHWLSAWAFAPFPGRAVDVHGMVTLRPRGGLPLLLSRRSH